jgi:hypothetical protein
MYNTIFRFQPPNSIVIKKQLYINKQSHNWGKGKCDIGSAVAFVCIRNSFELLKNVKICIKADEYCILLLSRDYSGGGGGGI